MDLNHNNSSIVASYIYGPASPAAGQTVQFTDTSTGTPTSWQWNFNDGSTSTSQNPSHAFATAGSYAVSLIASNGSGSNAVTQIVIVAPASTLTASFSYSPGSPAPGQAVQFTDTSTGSPTSWQWNFGDGSTSTSQNPSHAFATVGSYSVTLVASNGSGPSSFSRVIGVDSPSTIIPTDRRIDWTYSGIPGGIPNRTTIYLTLNPGATAAQINTAIANCPSGQVVYLNAGTYNLSGVINMKSNVTLRGAGPNKTIINTTQGISAPQCWDYTGVPLISGYTKGSTSVVVSNAAGFAVGNTMMFDQDDDTSLVMSTDGPGRNFRTMARVTGIAGNTISFTPPLVWTLSASKNPKAAYPAYGVWPLSLAGVEDLTINAPGSIHAIIEFYGSDRCWAKNLELSGGDSIFIYIPVSLQFEMRHCYVHDTLNAPSNADGYGICPYEGASYCLIEDNIFKTMSAGVYQSQSSGNAFLYNYGRDSTRYDWQKLIEGFNCNHGPYGMMSLWEGNVMETFLNDGYHGSCGYQTLFRNQIHGVHARGYTGNRKMVGLCRGSYYHNIVGNVLGDPSWNPVRYEMTGEPGYDEQPVIYALGYPNGWNNDLTSGNWLMYSLTYPDAKVKNTLLRHGNYDYFNDAVVWDPAISSHAIPNSLFYSSKPSYFGALQWPPIGPDVFGLVTSIPAKARWDAYVISGNKNDLF